MTDRMIKSAAWSDAVVEGVIDADADRLLVGGWVKGLGEAWLDDFVLTIDGAPVAIANAGFENGMTGWRTDIGDDDEGQGGYTFRPWRRRTAARVRFTSSRGSP